MDYINHFDCSNLEELANAIDRMVEDSNDHPSDTVYLTQPTRVTLWEETLTDGSLVKNISLAFID